MAGDETVRRLTSLHERIGPLRGRLEQVHAEIGTLLANPREPLPESSYFARLRALVAEVEAIQEEVRTSFEEVSGRLDRVIAEE